MKRNKYQQYLKWSCLYFVSNPKYIQYTTTMYAGLSFLHISANNISFHLFLTFGEGFINIVSNIFFVFNGNESSLIWWKLWNVVKLLSIFVIYLSVNYKWREKWSKIGGNEVKTFGSYHSRFVYGFVSKSLTKWFVVSSICWH